MPDPQRNLPAVFLFAAALALPPAQAAVGVTEIAGQVVDQLRRLLHRARRHVCCHPWLTRHVEHGHGPEEPGGEASSFPRAAHVPNRFALPMEDLADDLAHLALDRGRPLPLPTEEGFEGRWTENGNSRPPSFFVDPGSRLTTPAVKSRPGGPAAAGVSQCVPGSPVAPTVRRSRSRQHQRPGSR